MRESFEVYFAESRRSRGVAKRPTFERRADGTYTDDHTQRHWWTWQQATRNERERIKAALNAMLHCPCCDTTGVCDDECTFAADCPHESQSMQYLRDVLTGA